MQYYFLILWRILGILPPSKAYMEQLKNGFSDPSESDILHTLRWSSRLRVSTYVNWVKVCLKQHKQANDGKSANVLESNISDCFAHIMIGALGQAGIES